MTGSFGRMAVIAITGVSRTQLDHWEKKSGLLPSPRGASGKGSRKEYSFKDLVQIKVAKGLRDNGVSLQKIGRALKNLRAMFPDIEVPLAGLRFLTDGETIFVLTPDPEVILDTLKHQLVFSFAIGQVIEELKAVVRQFSKPKSCRIDVRGNPYTAVITPDLEDGGFMVTCDEIPAALSQGDTEQECLDNITDAIELCLGFEDELPEAAPREHYRQAR